VTNLLEGLDLDAVMYAGDDLTDVDAFRSIVRLAEEGRISRAIRVGVKSPEAPRQILSEADVLVDGPSGVAELLSLLLID
jgi:trehalose 6-phosphate phosphatase